MRVRNSTLCRPITSSSLATLLFLLACLTLPAGAQETRPRSLRLVPADVAFYASMLRNKEQWDALMNSRAVARIKEMPIVNEAMSEFAAEWHDEDGDAAPLRLFLDLPENRRLVDTLVEMASHEIFVYGSDEFNASMQLILELGQVAQRAAVLAGINDEDPETARARALVKLLNEHPGLNRVPEMIIGFRVDDTERAGVQLERLEVFVRLALHDHPELREKLQTEDIAGNKFLTLRLDGSLIPWDELPLRELQDAGADVESLREKCEALKLTISVGVREEYVLVSIGEDNDHLRDIGTGELLADRHELEPIAAAEVDRLAWIGYISEQFVTTIGLADRKIGHWVDVARQALPALELEEPVEQRLADDAETLGEELKSLMPRPGAIVNLGILTGTGYDEWTYNYGENPYVDGARPLPILDHLGGDPWFAIAGRAVREGNVYAFLSKWIGKAKQYFDEFGVYELDKEDREHYEAFNETLVPLLQRLDRATGEMLIPALGDGQGAFVLDAKLSSDQWQALMPKSNAPLPLLEPALVYGVSDADLLKKAAVEYVAIVNDAIDALHQIDPGEVPAYKVPEPEHEQRDGVAWYWYQLPPGAGFDERITPAAALSEEYLALALSRDHVQRLMEVRPLAASDFFGDRPLAMTLRFEFAAFITAIRPWIEYTAEQILGSRSVVAAEVIDDDVAPIMQQIDTVLDVLACFERYEAVTYLEDKIFVTHARWHFQDVAEER